MSKVKIVLQREGQESPAVIGIKVKDRQASVADLLNAWQPLCDDRQVLKQYGDQLSGICKGCRNNCCNTAYVIPDLLAFKKMAAYLQLDHQDFIAAYFEQEKVEAGLLRLRPGPCIFLRDNICSIYPFRSLICRFYLCSPMEGDCEQLIYSIAWAGSAALLIFTEQNQLIAPSPQASLSSFDLMFKRLLEDYRDTPQVKAFMHAEDYSDIRLQLFLP